jgi:hypothetical protein
MSLHFLLLLVGDADGVRAGGAKIGPYLRPLVPLIMAIWQRSEIEQDEAILPQRLGEKCMMLIMMTAPVPRGVVQETSR